MILSRDTPQKIPCPRLGQADVLALLEYAQ